jgi:hypothetical protein
MQLIQPIRAFFVVKTEVGVTAAMGVVYNHCVLYLPKFRRAQQITRALVVDNVSKESSNS